MKRTNREVSPGARGMTSLARRGSGGVDGVWPRIVGLTLALIILAMGLLHPAFRHPEGHLGAQFCFLLACSLAAAMIALTAQTIWSPAARWLALALVGQAAALQLVSAGYMVGYQHYLTLGKLADLRNAPSLLVIAAQFVFVIAAGRGRIGNWLRALYASLGASRLLALAAVFVLTSATLSRSLPAYVAELAFAAFIQALNLANVVIAIAALPPAAIDRLRQRFNGMLDMPDADQTSSSDWFAVLPAIWVVSVSALLAWFVYQNHPHVPDELVYLYPARYFAHGMLAMPLPPVPQAFQLDLMTYEATRWYSPVPPGWPAALSLGVLAGVPWLVNPVLNGINVLLAYRLFRELYDRRTARTAVLLLCLSPWFVFMGMNFMTHTFTLACALAASVAVARLRHKGSVWWAVPGGIAIGIVGIIRPLEGLTVAVLLGFWTLGGLPLRAAALGRVLVLALASIATGATVLPYNAYLSGNPFTFPLMAYTDSVYGVGTNALGFGASRGLGWPGLDPIPGHGAIDVLVNGNLNAFSVNIELFGWSTGSLLLLTLLILSRRLKRQDVWLMVAIAAIVGIHSFYWFSGGPDFGARYWYLIVVPCIGLSARAVQVAAELITEAWRGADAAAVRVRVTAGVFALGLLALGAFFPWRAMDKYYHYRNMRPDVRRLAAQYGFGRSLVLVRGKRHPDYASAAIYNPLDLTADVPLYVWDRDTAITQEALLAYQDRVVWILDGPTRTGAGFRVVAGPIPARSLLTARPAAARAVR